MRVAYKLVILIFVFALWVLSIISYKNFGENGYEGFMTVFGTISFISMCSLSVRYPLMLSLKYIKNKDYKKYLLKLFNFFSKEHLFFAILTITALIEHNLFYLLYHSLKITISIPCIIGYIAIGLFIINIVLGELLASKKKIKHIFKIHVYVAIVAVVFMAIHALLMD
jgi:hypothetical protein